MKADDDGLVDNYDDVEITFNHVQAVDHQWLD